MRLIRSTLRCQLADLMKTISSDWLKLIKTDFPMIKQKMVISSITEASLKAKIDADTGVRMLNKARNIASFVINHLGTSWIEPIFGGSGKRRDGK